MRGTPCLLQATALQHNLIVALLNRYLRLTALGTCIGLQRLGRNMAVAFADLCVVVT